MRATANLRAGIYSRESKDKTKSIDDQTAEALEAVADRGWDIVGEYSDGSSASRFGRKVRQSWRRLLADLDAGLLDVVVVWEPSRADRDLETWVTFVSRCRTRGALVHLTGDGDTLDPRNPSHWHRLITGGVDAAMESEKVSKRSRRGISRSAAAGRPHGPAPFGYERVIVGEVPGPHGPKPVREQRPDGDAPLVVEVFERIARSEPISVVVRDLQERGIPTPKGGPWSRHTVRQIVRNVAYLGERRHRSVRDGQVVADERYDGVWPGLVDADLFHRAQAVLDQPDRRRAKPGAARHLLSYIATAPCGAMMHCAPGEEIGRSPRYVCFGNGCVSVLEVAADEVVAKMVCRRLGRPDVREMFTQDDGAARPARVEAAELRRRLDLHYDEAAEGRLSAGGLAAVERRLLPLIEAADRRARPVPGSGAMAELLAAAEFGPGRVRPVWDGLPVAARREVVSQMAEVRVAKASRRLSRWATDDERLVVAAHQLAGSRWISDDMAWSQTA